MARILFLWAIFVTAHAVSNAQISGNQVYGNGSSAYSFNNTRSDISTHSTDSTLVISARILYNKLPDYYIVTLAVSQEGKTIADGVGEINKRIENFIRSLAAIGVKKEDCYIDYVAQPKIYDYNIKDGNKAEQYENGFEIKKNIIIRLNDMSKFDDLVALASKEDIYDIVKVDYKDKDADKMYAMLFDEAQKIIGNKKNLYLKTGQFRLKDKSGILNENFYTVYPNTQYKQYQAYESADVNDYGNYNTGYLKKEQRKAKTFFYDGINTSGFDKVVNDGITKIGIQYYYELAFVYYIDRN